MKTWGDIWAHRGKAGGVRTVKAIPPASAVLWVHGTRRQVLPTTGLLAARLLLGPLWRLGERPPAAAPGALLDDSETRKIGSLRVKIDRLICVGFGDCIDEAPGVFEFDDEGIAAFKNGADSDEERVMEACRSCPVDALEVFDEDGVQLHP